MATIVKFYKDGKKVKDITSIGYLPVDEDAVKDSRHLASSGSVIAAAALGEESMMANLPIAANTLRFSFGDLSYDPTVAGAAPSGTWTKKNTKFTNVWDWTNTNTSWATAFGSGSSDPGAFADYENNPVKVIAAGDTSSVTDFSRLFQRCYAITEICPIDTSNATNVYLMFTNCKHCEKFPDLDFSNANDIRSVFAVCTSMVEAPWVVLPTGHSYSLQNFFFGCHKLKKIPLYNTSKCNSMAAFLQWDNTTFIRMEIDEIPEFDTSNVSNFTAMLGGTSIKTIPNLDLSNATSVTSMFISSFVEEVPDLSLTKNYNARAAFKDCIRLKEIPNWDWTLSTRLDNAFDGCESLTEIPDMGIPTNCTRCDNMFNNCVNIKSGITRAYDNLSQVSGITNHADCFKDCGSATESGRAELAQIPVSWGGTKEENP